LAERARHELLPRFDAATMAREYVEIYAFARSGPILQDAAPRNS